ncbi:MAG: GNAT family N-acetyltransferase, partial [Verrucomicrobiota bacterium]
RNHGIGSSLLKAGEEHLIGRGCLKINLQIIESNRSVEAFYRKQGYNTEPRISMGKILHT